MRLTRLYIAALCGHPYQGRRDKRGTVPRKVMARVLRRRLQAELRDLVAQM